MVRNNSIQLNTLPYLPKEYVKDGKIWDIVRKKWLQIIPEELVRQSVVSFLNQRFGLHHGRMSLEKTIGSHQKRLDLLYYSKKGNPLLIVECKSWKIPLSDATFQQLGTYNYHIRAPLSLITNGKEMYIYEVSFEEKSFHPLDIDQLSQKLKNKE